MKYNASGDAQWVRTIFAGGGGSQFRSVAIDAGGNVYAAGYQSGTGIYDYGNGCTVQGANISSNSVLVKYNANGEAQWAKTILFGDYNSNFNSIAIDAGDNVYAAGYQYGAGIYNYGNECTAQGASTIGNSVFVKYNANGDAQWARTILAATSASTLSSVAIDAGGNVYTAGYQDGAGIYDYGNGCTAQGTGTINPVLVKYRN